MSTEPAEEGAVHDDRLRLVFTYCHPSLATSAQVALTLRLLGGLTTREIARAFLVPEATMAQRLVRAKAKIRATRIPYRVPHRGRPAGATARRPRGRLPSSTTEGHTASSGEGLTRPDLCAEAVRLSRLAASRADARRTGGPRATRPVPAVRVAAPDRTVASSSWPSKTARCGTGT